MSKKNATLANLAAPAPVSAPDAQEALTVPAHGGAKLKAPKAPTKVVGVHLRLDTHRALKQASVDDGITASARVQALLDILDEDPDLAARVAARVSVN